MAGETQITIKDGGSTNRTMNVWSSDGTITGNLSPLQAILGADGATIASAANGFAVTVENASLAITAAALPLPAGAATAAGLTTINTTLGSPMQASGGSVTANAGTNLNTSALATSANLTAGTQLTQIGNGTNTAAIKASVTAPLATDPALVVTISPNCTNANGSAVSASSAPVVIASDQAAVAIKGGPAGSSLQAWTTRTLKRRQRTVITSSTAETTIVTAVASIFLDLYGLVLSNSSASATTVDIRDTTGGSIVASFEIPAGDTRGFMLPLDSGIPQAAVNTNWTAQCGTSVASLTVTALFANNS